MNDSLKLDNQLCFPIYALSRQITNMYRPHLDKLGLTYPQYLVMMVLWENKEVTVKQLGELLWLDSGTLTPLLKRMESGGWLVRKRSLKDERVVDILITEAGSNLRLKAEEIPSLMKLELGISDEELPSLKNKIKEILNIAGKCDV